jgi:hypothetical protein
MRKGRLVASIVGVVGMAMVASAGTTAVAATKPLVVHKNVEAPRPQLVVDSKGTVDVSWQQADSQNRNTVEFAPQDQVVEEVRHGRAAGRRHQPQRPVPVRAGRRGARPGDHLQLELAVRLPVHE